MGPKHVWDDLRYHRKKIFLLDGGTGEELFQRGVPDDRKIWSATALVNPQYHKVLADVHRSFLQAGADAITTNSYGVVPGVGFSTEDIATHVATAGRIAREVVNEDTKTEKLVLGSLGPLLESYRPDRLMEANEGIKIYKIMAQSLAPFVDIFIAETMSCVEESTQAICAVGQLNAEAVDGWRSPTHYHPMLVSYTLNSEGLLRNGESAKSAVTRTLAMCEERSVELVGVLFNCSEPESITTALKAIHDDVQLQQILNERRIILGAYANRLTAVDPNWSLEESDAPQPTRTDLSVERYNDEFVSCWVKELGAQIVGGCCGVTPEYIAAIHSSLRNT